MDHRVAAAISIMHEQLADRISILSLSRSVNLSPSRLRQLFKKDIGQSPMQYPGIAVRSLNSLSRLIRHEQTDKRKNEGPGEIFILVNIHS
jgi:AraC-like DNA-binding protein